MYRIQDVKLEIVRPGPPHNQLLSPLTSYMGLCGDGSPVTFHVDFEHRQLLNRLEHLRYVVPKPKGGFETVAEGTRTGELNDLASDMADVLSRIPSINAELNLARSFADPAGARGFVHLRLILSGSELSLLPFELAAAPQSFPGEGLHFCLQGSLPVVVTREIRRSRPIPIGWNQYKEPRVLFISAAPGSLSVPTRSHTYALRAALEPWIEWPRDRKECSDIETTEPKDRTQIEHQRIDRVRDRLRILVNPSLEQIYKTCAREQFSHIHILAHGDYHTQAGESRFGIALCKHGKPNEKVVVDGVKLASSLHAAGEDGEGRSAPVMVTLNICDSGQTGSVLVPGGSIAHDLHTAGIPWVFASQFPLTKRGSARMAEFMYPRLFRGDDPRRVLYELRRYLHMNAQDDHDWASLVCYAALPDDFDHQVAAYFENQTRLAIEVQLGKADAIVEGRAPAEKLAHPDADVGKAAVDAEKQAIEDAHNKTDHLLDAWGRRLPGGISMKERVQRTSCYGIKGSALKRLGLVYGKRGEYARAREVLDMAYQAYAKAMLEWATDGVGYHWTATQYLCLSAVLGREPDGNALALSRQFAERDKASASVDNETRAWAHGTLAELELISLWHNPTNSNVKEDVLRHCSKIIELTGPESTQVKSTRRQFRRYVNRWYLKNWNHNEMSSVASAAVDSLTTASKAGL